MADIEIAAAMSFDGAQVVTQVKVITTEVEKAKTSLEALSGVLDDVKKGFSAVTGTLDLFGIKSEGVQKALEKVKAALDVAEGLQSISKLGEGFDKLGTAIKSTTAFKVLDSAATEAAAVVQEAFTGAVDTTTASFGALKIAIATTGIGLLIVGIGELISYLKNLSEASSQAAINEKNVNDVRVEAAKNTVEEKTRLDELLEVAKNNNASLKDRQAAIQGINDIAGKHIGNITLEAVETGKAVDKIKDYVKALDAKALADAYNSKLTELYKQKIEEQNKSVDESLSLFQKAKVGVLAYFYDINGAADETSSDYKNNIKESTDLIQGQIDNLKKAFDEDLKTGKAKIDLDTQDDELNQKELKRLQDNLDAKLSKDKVEQQLQLNQIERAGATEEQKHNVEVVFLNKRISLLQAYYENVKGVNSDAAVEARKHLTESQNELILLKDNYYTKSITDLDAYIKNFGNELKKHEKDLQPPPPPEDKDPNNYDGPGALPFGLGPNGVRPGYEGAATKGLQQLHGMQDFSNSLQGLTTDGDKLNAQAGRGVSGVAGHFAEQLKALQDFHTKAKDLATKGYGDMKAVDKAYADAKVNLFLSVGSQILGSAADLFGKQTAAGKAISIAQTTIDTYQSATAAYKAVVGIPVVGPALAPVAAGAAVLSGLANIKKILAVQVPGQSSGGSAPSVDTSTPAAPLTPSPVQTSTTLNQDQINQIGNAASRVYVLDSDIQNNRERDARLNRAARLGG